MLVESKSVIKTWKKLKTVLENEFAENLQCLIICNEMLAKRKLKKEKTVQEYYMMIRKLTSSGKIEQEYRLFNT